MRRLQNSIQNSVLIQILYLLIPSWFRGVYFPKIWYFCPPPFPKWFLPPSTVKISPFPPFFHHFPFKFTFFFMNHHTFSPNQPIIQISKIKNIRPCVGLGFPAAKIVYDSPVKTPKELKAAIGRNMPLTGWPVIHGRVFMVPFRTWLVQCTLLYTLNKVPEQHDHVYLVGFYIIKQKCVNLYLTCRI